MTTNRTLSLDWQPELGTDGIVDGMDDIDQCIRTILQTPKGSDPHRPEFGSKIHLYIDWPQTRVTPYLVRETVAAIRRWEPRVGATIVRLNHTIAWVELIVEWLPASGGEAQSTTVRFAR